MKERKIMGNHMLCFAEYLRQEEKSEATQEKYLRDVKAFASFAGEREIEKNLVREWKEHLCQSYAVQSVNAMLASVNSFLNFVGWEDCKVKNLRFQRQTYCPEEKELTKGEYLRLLKAARENEQLYLLLQTICATGIRVSEVKYFTLEAVSRGEVRVRCKNKTRTILVPGKLKKQLIRFAQRKRIENGPIFLGKYGKQLDRSSIWRQMKKLCVAADVEEGKVFPHNLRKLFARSFYELDKDIAKLSDLLGHSSINTTRIYIMTTGVEHLKKIERLGLVM